MVCLVQLVLGGSPLAAQQVEAESWWTATAPGVVVHTDAPLERGLDVALALSRFRAVFARLSPAIELRSPAPTTVLAFRDAESYAPFHHASGGATILGQFLGHADGNLLTLDAGTRLVGSYAVVFHETVHYFLRHNMPWVPLWFNEGLAEYYSTLESEGDRVVLGRPVEHHLAALRRGGGLSLDELLTAGAVRSWRGHPSAEVGGFYATSWLLVHYLMSGDGARLDRTADLLTRLAAGDDPLDALESALDRSLGQLEDDLAGHLAELPTPRPVRVEGLPSAEAVAAGPVDPAALHTHLGELLLRLGDRIRAEASFDHALRLDPEHDGALGGLAFLRQLSGRIEEATVLFQDAARRPMTWPMTALRRGRQGVALAAGADPVARPALLAAARSSLDRALELYPDYGEAFYLLGVCELLADEPARSGVRALERAHALMPDRSDVVSALARLLARRGEAAEARRWVEGELATFGDPELVAATRDEVERLLLLKAFEAAVEAGEHAEAMALLDRAIEFARDPEVRQSMEQRLLALQETEEGIRR